MRGSGAEVPAAIWSSERRLTAGYGEGGRNDAELAASTPSPTAGFAFGDLGCPAVRASRPIQPNPADRCEV